MKHFAVFVFAAFGGLLSFAAHARDNAPQLLYGDEVVYEVLLGGKVAGEHRLRFDGDHARLTVMAQTRATIVFYGFLDMPFQYDSLAVWQGGTLAGITASYLRGFWRGTASLRSKDGVYQTGGGESFSGVIFPANHWHSGVLLQERVFNTLGGGIAKVRITPDAKLQTIAIGGKMRRARRYVYDGDLQLESWYEENGRWIKMRFAAFGGEYAFVCKSCEPRR